MAKKAGSVGLIHYGDTNQPRGYLGQKEQALKPTVVKDFRGSWTKWRVGHSLPLYPSNCITACSFLFSLLSRTCLHFCSNFRILRLFGIYEQHITGRDDEEEAMKNRLLCNWPGHVVVDDACIHAPVSEGTQFIFAQGTVRSIFLHYKRTLPEWVLVDKEQVLLE